MSKHGVESCLFQIVILCSFGVFFNISFDFQKILH